MSIGFEKDSFSSGQVGSKLWLCEELERLLRATTNSSAETIWVYGGWQGVMGFLLLSRAAFKKAIIRSFDLDSSCESRANVLCENWVWRQWQFRAFTADCNQLRPLDPGEYGKSPTLVINTSVEHFSRREWFENIPTGTLVALQASDFEHDGAVALYADENSLADAFPLSEILFRGRLNFTYEKWSFHRFMVIGIK